MEEQFLVRFWGVRGSYPVPGVDTVKYGGNTPCVEVQVAGHTIILDGGTGLIALGKDLIRRSVERGEPVTATILFSHTHHDHTQGLPYFEPAYLGSSTFYIFGPRFFRHQLSETLARTMLPPNFPIELDDLHSLRVIRDLRETEQLYLWPQNARPQVRNIYSEDEPPGAGDAVRVDVAKSFAHPQEGVFFYRITYKNRTLVYATDTEGYIGGDQRLQRFARGADLLIHDAHYTSEEYLDPALPKQGWGHSTPEMAVEVAQSAGVKRLALFHLNPMYSDSFLDAMEGHMQEMFEGGVVAREGLVLNLFNHQDGA